MIGTFSEEELSKEVERTYFEGLLGFYGCAPDAWRRQEADMSIFSTGLPMAMLNGVIGPRFAKDRIAERVDAAMVRFEERRLPMMWLLGPSSGPAELDELLARRGMAREEVVPGMAASIADAVEGPMPPGLEIYDVEDPDSLRHAAEITAAVFGIPDGVAEAWGETIGRYGMGPRHRWFLGFLHGRPVSASLLVLHERVAGIYNVATMESARGRGIGTAMTREAMVFARNAGRRVAILEASGMGLPLYQKLGFRKVCEFRLFTWAP
jgi:ribosomal protein S18 acetylase RimI-like enzyme